MTTMTLDLACEQCCCDIDDATFDRNEGTCDCCRAKSFECAECGERTYPDNAHATEAKCCEYCGDNRIAERHQEAMDAAAEELSGLVEALSGYEDLETLRKAIKALKRLVK